MTHPSQLVVSRQFQALVLDLEDTLVEAVPGGDLVTHPEMYAPIDGTIEFLDRVADRFAPGSTAVFTMANALCLNYAFENALDSHEALKFAPRVCNAQKISSLSFAKGMGEVKDRLSVDVNLKDIVFIDDNPYAVLNALQEGVGFVVLVSNDDLRFYQLITSIEGRARVRVEQSLETRFGCVESLAQIFFE